MTVLSVMVNGSPQPINMADLTGGQAAVTKVSITRPNNTTEYTAGDVIGTATDATSAIAFSGLANAQRAAQIIGSSLRIDVNAVPSGMTSFRLHLYNVTPPSAIYDNVAWDLPSGDRASYIGYIDLGTPVDLGSTLYVESSSQAKLIVIPAAGVVYGYLVNNGTHTPAAQTVYTITLTTLPKFTS